MTTAALLDSDYDADRPLRTLILFFRGDRLKLAGALLAFTVKSSPIWLLPLFTANIIDIVIQHRPERQLWIQAAILLVVLLQNVPMHLFYVRNVSRAIRDMETRLRGSLCSRLQQLSIGFHRRSDPGILQSKVMRDVENVGLAVRESFDLGVGAVTTLVGGIVITAIKAPVFLPLLLLAIPTGATLGYGMRRRMRDRNAAFRRTIERLSSGVSEMTHLVTLTRAHGLEGTALSRIDDQLREVRNAGVAVDTEVGFFGSISWTVFQLLGGGCLVTAAWVAYHHFLGVTAGDVVLISTFFVTLTASVTQLMNLAPALTKGLESVRSIGEVLQAADLERNEGKARVSTVAGGFTFDRAGYSYAANPATDDEPALAELSLVVEPGETIAFVGASGSGKSTLLNLVIGLFAPSSGRVLLDGRDMASLDLRTYRRHLAIVPQEPLLFAGSVRDNVTYGQPDLSDEAVHDALVAANAWDFVQRMSDGLDTPLGDRGTLLSGGQKQRIAIARALIRDPRVLVLDEATSALDTSSEALVREALARLMHGRTCFVVAHRLSTVRSADRIVVLDQGRIVEVGDHSGLVAAAGPYSALHAASMR
ncbi:ABC transporter ATP-binding protein [Acidothermaceae bacterium B102]|nr:ABC transporter ATP-binding protein [Acidothermaceae bacterium B102]